ncbi:MAG TPA: 4Fe-4S binding protein [Syntrophobacter fumaroxidans]|nr:4Fe-4S binding protein [Syntrophobacter fumaroxidans]
MSKNTTVGKKSGSGDSRARTGSRKHEGGKENEGKANKGKRAFHIDIFKGWCKACGICAAFCPRECIRLDEDGSPLVAQPERCTGCGWCELHCPDFAISVKPLKHPPAEEAEL